MKSARVMSRSSKTSDTRLRSVLIATSSIEQHRYKEEHQLPGPAVCQQRRSGWSPHQCQGAASMATPGSFGPGLAEHALQFFQVVDVLLDLSTRQLGNAEMLAVG